MVRGKMPEGKRSAAIVTIREADTAERPKRRMTKPTPAVARRELGTLLRGLRKERGLRLGQVAESVHLDAGFLSRVERGFRGLGDDNADRLSEFYALPPRTRSRIRQLARIARESTWWDDVLMLSATREYVGFEQAATAIMTYGSIVHGLLQTRAYGEAMVERTAVGSPDEYRDGAVQHRLHRQELLDRADPPWFWVILDESALHRLTGGPDVRREQLVALRTAADRPRVSVRVLPFSAGAHPGLDSRFTMVSTSRDHRPELVYVEGLSGARNLSKSEDLAKYVSAWQALSALALSEDDTAAVIAAVVSGDSTLSSR
jgi:transcriptional regulator with XRE-family HTH domain